MVDMERILKQLEESEVLEITTKELKEQGLNQYYIQKALEQDRLRRVQKGCYLVTLTENKKKSYDYFKKFVAAVFRLDYAMAYEYLKKNAEYSVSHQFDNHLRCYFILLEELLDIPKVALTEKNIYEFGDKANSETTYYNYFVQFRQNVLAYDFASALGNIKVFREMEKNNKGKNSISTKVFYHLANAIYFKDRDKDSEDNVSFKQNSMVSLHSEQNEKSDVTVEFEDFYHKFEEAIYCAQYEDAFSCLKQLQIQFPEKKELNDFFKILNDYLRLQEANIPLKILQVKNASLEKNLLQLALEQNDYEKADQLLKTDSCDINSSFVPMYHTLLQLICKRNQELIVLQQRVDESKKQEKWEEIVKLVFSHDYAFLDTKIEQYMSVYGKTRMLAILFRLVQQYKSGVSIDEVQHVYENDRLTQIFKRFYEAVRCQDYKEAIYCANICHDLILNWNKDPLEFDLYGFLLSDLQKSKEEKLILLEEQKYQEKIEQQFNKIAFQTTQSNINLEDLLWLLNEKEKYGMQESEVILMNFMVELIELISRIEEPDSVTIIESDFGKQVYQGSTIEKLQQALRIGDYPSAFELLNYDKWFDKKMNDSIRRYYSLYRKLLSRFKQSLSWKYDMGSQKIESQSFGNDIKKELSNHQVLVDFIEKNDFYGAFQFYLQNKNKYSEKLQIYIETYLRFLAQHQRLESEETLKQYKEAFINGLFSQAEEQLSSYENEISNTGLNRNTDYYHQRLSWAKEITSQQFLLELSLYRDAKISFHNKDYSLCVQQMGHLLSVNEKNAKAFALRGRAYEYLHQYELAQHDYEKSLALCAEPYIFYRLGKVHQIQGNYEQALFYFLQCEERRPFTLHINMKAIIQVSELLNRHDLKEKYEMVLAKTESDQFGRKKKKDEKMD